MTLRLIARPSGILVPRDDFGLKDIPARDLVLGDDIGFVAALLLGNDGNQSRLLKVDANGNLRITTAGQALPSRVGIVRPSDGTALDVTNAADAAGGPFGLGVFGVMSVFNGAFTDRQRSASAANMAAQSGLGATLADAPGEWGATHLPAAGVVLNATRAAGGAGVRHVARTITVTMSSQAAIALSTIQFQLYDGGAFPWSILFDLPAAIVAPFAMAFQVHIVGSANAVMAVQSTPAVAGLRVTGTLSGYDVS